MAALNGAYTNHVENGREFHGFRRGLYMYPCDEQEKDRMDIYHTLFLVARNKKLHDAPIAEPITIETRILDVGTGTGIWAIDMADKYPLAEVIGLDLANIQPPSIPPNLRFRVPRDYESMWSLGQDSWDLIHLRTACGGVSSWSEMYQKVFQHLKLGTGYLEQVEIDLRPRCDDGPVPTRLQEWYDWLADSTNRGGKPIEYPRSLQELLRQQGFVDIEERVIRMNLSPWSSGSQEGVHERDIGRWYNLGLNEGVEALSLGPLTRVYEWPAADVRRLVGEVKALICDKRYHLYNNLHVITARRPSHAEASEMPRP